MIKRLFSLLTVLLILPYLFRGASAQEFSQMGSISVALPGGSVTLYRAGEIQNYRFLPTGDFSGWDGTLDDLQSPELALALEDYARKNGCTGITKSPANGTVTFSDLEPGLYLITQSEAAEGCEPIAPFLISLPFYENGRYNYQIDASPKIEITKPPTEPDPSGPNLPQTGQLNWPVPVLIISGLSLFAFGMFLYKRKRHG